MKFFRVLIALIAVGWPATSAWGQIGLSGSPELLRFSDPAAGQQAGYPYPSTSAYPSTSTSPGGPSALVASYPGPFFQYVAAAPPGTPPTQQPQPIPQPHFPQPAGAPPAGLQSAGPQPMMSPQPVLQPALQPAWTPQPVPQPRAGMGTFAVPPATRPGASGGLVGQMLADPTCANGNCWSGYGAAPAVPGACGGDTGESGALCYQPAWYASASGLFMTRNQGNRVWVTYITDHNAEQVLHTQVGFDWQGGFEVRLGRILGTNSQCGQPCSQWAIEAGYWRLLEMTGFGEVPERDYDSDPLGFSYSTPLSLDGVIWANGQPGTPRDIFDFARQYRVWRTSNVQNIELNLIRHQLTPDCSNAVAIDWSLGARYFQFDEQLKIGALQQTIPPTPPNVWGGQGGQCEAYLDENIHNALVGFQFGFNAAWTLAPNLRLFVSPKFGIYNNHIEHRFAGYRGDGLPIAPDPASGVTGTFPVSASTDVLSFLTEVNLGLDWCIAPRWDLFLGYRVIWATGIGLADNQILPYVVDIPGHQHIESNGDLIVHGAFAGLTISF